MSFLPGAVPDAVLHLVLMRSHSRENSWSGTNIVVDYIGIAELSGRDKFTTLGKYMSRLGCDQLNTYSYRRSLPTALSD